MTRGLATRLLRTCLLALAIAATGVALSACAGEQGVRGPQGLTGEAGAQGATGQQGQPGPEAQLPEPSIEIAAATRSFSQIVEESLQSVVAIRTPAGTGSGFFFRDELILTNAHVVGHFNKVTINVRGGGCDGRCDYSPIGSVVGVDDVLDLAVISVSRTSRRPALIFGDSQQLDLAEEIIALGYPVATILGFNLTVTKGIVSSAFTLEGASYLLTDAPLNPGNSGGPLLNSAGEVIGISTGNVQDPRSGLKFDGMGVAIPSNSIRERLPSLLE
jgi:S1-C subfamily serine protease